MKQNALSKKGLSMSQAQSISNLCNQRANEIDRVLNKINNFSKTVEVNGRDFILTTPIRIPTNVIELLKEKAALNACQGFLMENIKAKDVLIKSINSSQPDFSDIKYPEKEVIEKPIALSLVTEDWGWEQLTAKELADFYEAEAYAAQIGKFIHKGSKLEFLREELPTIPSIEWMVIEDGKKSPVKINIHHNSEQLMNIHEELAIIHREYESKVNYFKAKVKNLTTEENARRSKLNEVASNEYSKKDSDAAVRYSEAYIEYSNKVKNLANTFAVDKQAKLKEASTLRIEVDPRFQSIIDKFKQEEE